MITALPIAEIVLKYGFYVLGPAIVVIGAFILGIRHADKNARLDRLDAEKELRQDINRAEQSNQKIEEKRNETINSIRDTDVVDSLIKLFHKGPWGPKGRD